MRSIFSDKATIVIRAMISQPERKWVVRDFEKEFGVSSGMASLVLKNLRQKGFVGGISSGRLAYNILIEREELIEQWVNQYSFEANNMFAYYSPDKDILLKIKKYCAKKGLSDKYALTLHTGANFITSYVKTDSLYCYLDSENFDELSLSIRQGVDLKELKTGGNVFFIKPYYKKSVFFEKQKIHGYSVVSNLQLYLDLHGFPQRGKGHADYLLKVLKEEGNSFARGSS